MAVASVDDVAVALGRSLTPEEVAQASWWLTGIERFIVRRLGPVAALVADDVRYVEAEAVAEKIRRGPSRESSITVSVDDGSVTRRYDSSASASDITDEWWALLTPATWSGTAYTIAVSSPLDLP